MEEFKTGDVVVLKSGSPQMTIYAIVNNKTLVSCIYSNLITGSIEYKDVHTIALKKVD